jgi:23S rRNA pseudouridine1911/1915/1917 synthase
VALNEGYVYRDRFDVASGISALDFLAGRYRHSSREEWAARFERGEVRLDGVLATATDRPKTAQVLTWHRPPWEEPDTPQHFDVVHEDAAVLAVVKPSGLPTLPAGGYLRHTLLHLVQQRWPGATPLHRLGRATSGLVLFARTKEAAARLHRDFREGGVEKRYRALAQGIASEDTYEIADPIGLVPHPRLGSVYGASAGGKPARSTATVLERRAAETLFEVRIHTGRSEQIRIHLACIGHPLSGDPMFAAGGVPRAESPGLPGDGGYLLHAEWLAFTHPSSGERLLLHAPPPGPLCAAEGCPEGVPRPGPTKSVV